MHMVISRQISSFPKYFFDSQFEWDSIKQLNQSHLKGAMVESIEQLGPEVIKKYFMLNSAEQEIFPAHKC